MDEATMDDHVEEGLGDNSPDEVVPLVVQEVRELRFEIAKQVDDAEKRLAGKISTLMKRLDQFEKAAGSAKLQAEIQNAVVSLKEHLDTRLDTVEDACGRSYAVKTRGTQGWTSEKGEDHRRVWGREMLMKQPSFTFERAQQACSCAAEWGKQVDVHLSTLEEQRQTGSPENADAPLGWLAVILWGRKGVDNESAASKSPLDRAQRCLNGRLARWFLRRHLVLFLMVYESSKKSERSRIFPRGNEDVGENETMDADSGSSGGDAPWASFCEADKAVCAQYESLFKRGYVSEAAKAENPLGTLLFDCVRDDDFALHVNKCLREVEQGPSGNTFVKLFRTFVNGAVSRAFAGPDQIAAMRRNKKRRGRKGDKEDIITRWGPFQDLLVVLDGCKKSAKNCGNNVRKNVRHAVWQSAGYALYATIRGRPGWKIFIPALDDGELSMNPSGRTIPSAEVLEHNQEYEPDVSFPDPEEHERRTPGSRLRDSWQRERGKAALEISERNGDKLDELKASFPGLTVSVTFPVRPFREQLTESVVAELAGLMGVQNFNSATFDRKRLMVSSTSHVSLHEIALQAISSWTGVTPRRLALCSSKDSLLAVHAIALSLRSALKVGLERGNVDKLSAKEKAFLGDLRPFQVTKASEKGETDTQTTTPGLFTVAKIPWEMPADGRTFPSPFEEDKYFLHSLQSEYDASRKSSCGRAERQKVVLQERWVSVDEFRTIVIRMRNSDTNATGSGGGEPAGGSNETSNSANRRVSVTMAGEGDIGGSAFAAMDDSDNDELEL